MEKLTVRRKTVYRKAVVYFCAEVEFTTNEDLQEKIDEFETNVCLDLDNIHGGYYDYEFRYNGLEEIEKDNVSDWLFDD